MGTLFADVMGRDCMPQRYSFGEDEAVRHYLTLFMRAIGADKPAAPASPSQMIPQETS